MDWFIQHFTGIQRNKHYTRYTVTRLQNNLLLYTRVRTATRRERY